VDRDGKYSYSKVVLIKKDSKSINGITINPNPITNGTATVRITSSVRGTAELRVIDLTGRILIKQTQKIYEVITQLLSVFKIYSRAFIACR
jgi:hypothetical protein